MTVNETQKQGGQPPSGRRVLIADDEERLRKMYVLVLSDGIPSCSFDVAANGAEAVAAFRTGHHAVVVMDVRMPVMDGEAAFKEIQKVCEAENLKMPSVIFCTGYDLSDTIQRIVEKNPAHCLMMKPVRSTPLVQAIESRLPPA